MKVAIDGAGRVVVPKSLRDQLGLRQGSALEVTERGGELVLRPIGPPVGVAERGDRKVFVVEASPADIEPGYVLTDDDVRGLTESSRQWPRG